MYHWIINVINHRKVLTGKGLNNKLQDFRPFQCYHIMLLPTWSSVVWRHKEISRLTCLGLAKLSFKQNNWKQITVFADYGHKNLHKTANRFIRSLKKNIAKPHQKKIIMQKSLSPTRRSYFGRILRGKFKGKSYGQNCTKKFNFSAG